MYTIMSLSRKLAGEIYILFKVFIYLDLVNCGYAGKETKVTQPGRCKSITVLDGKIILPHGRCTIAPSGRQLPARKCSHNW